MSDIEVVQDAVEGAIEKKLLEEYEFSVNKQDSIKSRLQRNFLVISVAIVLLMSIFSLTYFYFFTKREAVSLIRNKIQLADVFMEAKKNETLAFAESIAADRSIQIGIDLASREKLTEYLMPQVAKEKMYYVTVFDSGGSIMADIGKTDSELFTGRKQISPSEQVVLQEALKDRKIIDTINLVNGLQELFPAYIAAVPVKRNNEVTGIVMVRFVFSDNFEFFSQLSRNLQSDLAIYVNAEPVIATDDLAITLEHYNDIALLKKNTERISLTGAGLNEYRGIFSTNGDPVAVLHVYLSSLPYITTFGAAALIYAILAVCIIIIVSFMVIRISATILNPIGQLLDGVNVVRSGNLAHEIVLTVKDEIGRLGTAFNEMRAQLNEKIFTIQEMNRGLEKTVEDRTRTIETLNNKMKHYLSPQLYASIAGGDREVSTEKHYRKKLTIFFSDIVDFTKTTESMEPEDLSALLNSYLDNMARIAEKYGGTIDKYVGDAVMVFFGDPEFTSDQDHALRAVKMGMEMLERLAELRIEWESAGIERPFHARMGINTGYCTIGNFGSETKMDYTIIGGNVNLAARYESAAKPDTILISYETYMLVRDEIECAEAGEYSLKGISSPVKAYNPVRVKNSKKSASLIKIVDGREIVFQNKVVDIDTLSIEEKRELLLNIRDVFDIIKGK
ncbi:HAMP domain-containing protein [Brucepastera parasyntrophica]|uniref:adenylate/guanylate cyclase domain-containing protein n=1 Tax=Brucepastera parasyntrophica TaxID=2880008 RepID=UPI00210B0D60|nr:adenylate/guanylate cyclase domain-containing protein [Brucepastera parasyntrophica]ULQ59731.1 HAMP domain-containing protein [Brucepastera parasyntrophica]